MNATIEKFGFPHSLVKEYDEWLVLARPTQVTLGSLVLAAKSDVTAFGQLSPAAFADLAGAVAGVEKALASFIGFERINYLMLMMVDPHVHFHVIPRYAGTRQWEDLQIEDQAWPGPPDVKTATALSPEQIERLAGDIRAHF